MFKYISTPYSVAIADKVRMLEDAGVSVAKMQTGEPVFDTPQYIIEGAYQAMKQGQTHYSSSQGIPSLRNEIINWYKSDYNIEFQKENILIENGAIHVIYCLVSSLINSGDEIIIPEPYWPQYEYITYLAKGRPKFINTIQSQWKLIPEILEKAITKNTKLIILNNPCNPTGIVYSKEEIDALIQVAEKYNIQIIFDEVYSIITYSKRFCSVFQSSLYEDMKSNIFYVNSFSKTFAMTGWRVGYAILPQSIMTKVLKISQNTITNVNTFS